MRLTRSGVFGGWQPAREAKHPDQLPVFFQHAFFYAPARPVRMPHLPHILW